MTRRDQRSERSPFGRPWKTRMLFALRASRPSTGSASIVTWGTKGTFDLGDPTATPWGAFAFDACPCCCATATDAYVYGPGGTPLERVGPRQRHLRPRRPARLGAGCSPTPPQRWWDGWQRHAPRRRRHRNRRGDSLDFAVEHRTMLEQPQRKVRAVRGQVSRGLRPLIGASLCRISEPTATQGVASLPMRRQRRLAPTGRR